MERWMFPVSGLNDQAESEPDWDPNAIIPGSELMSMIMTSCVYPEQLQLDDAFDMPTSWPIQPLTVQEVDCFHIPEQEVTPETVIQSYDQLPETKGSVANCSSRPATPTARPKPVYSRLAPKLTPGAGAGRESWQNQNNGLQMTGLKPKPKRKKYNKQDQLATAAAREAGICIRCRTLRERCRPDPADPSGPCLPCKTYKPRKAHMSRLPCLRYKISDCILNRTGLDYLQFYRDHPMVGPKYGDFHIERDWTGACEYQLYITQDCGSVCKLTVREFNPPDEPQALDLKRRPMYRNRFAIVNADQTTDSLNRFLDESIELYLDNLLDDGDRITFDVFHMALRLSHFPDPDPLLRKTLRLWVACRLIESRWRCCGEYNLGAEQLKDPFQAADWISPPPYIDYQLGSVIMHRILDPLRASVLKDLQKLVYAPDKMKNWFRIFLIIFILLHNYELGVHFQQGFAARRKSSVVYLDMPLIRGINSGAKTILAHFHTACKGQIPFSENVDYNTPSFRKMAELDKEQVSFLRELRRRVCLQSEDMRSVKSTQDYGRKFWFISQLFEQGWQPRETLEHSPEAS